MAVSVGFSKVIGFCQKPDIVWYILFMLFVPYAMLPLPLKWCMMAGTISSLIHIVMTIIELIKNNEVSKYHTSIICIPITSIYRFIAEQVKGLLQVSYNCKYVNIYCSQFCRDVHEIFDGS